jgi:hypothetical protein
MHGGFALIQNGEGRIGFRGVRVNLDALCFSRRKQPRKEGLARGEQTTGQARQFAKSCRLDDVPAKPIARPKGPLVGIAEFRAYRVAQPCESRLPSAPNRTR